MQTAAAIAPALGLDPGLLYPVQRRVIEAPATIRVLIAGRGAGKTAVASFFAADGATRGMGVLYVAPVAVQYEQAYRHFRMLLKDRHTIVPLGKDKRIVDRVTGGYVDLRSGKNPPNLRSGGYLRYVLDEADYLSERVSDTVYGALARGNSTAEVMVPTTPQDLPSASWVERDYNRGLRHEAGFESFRWTAWEVPHTSKTGLAWMRGGDLADLDSREWCPGDPEKGLQAGGVPREVYEREIMAHYVTARGVQLQREWVELARTKGRDEWPNLAYPPGASNPHFGMAFGMDSGFSEHAKSDRTVGAIVARDRKGNLWVMDAIEGRGGLDVHVNIARALYQKWRPSYGLMEARGSADLAVQAVAREVDRELAPLGIHIALGPRRPEEDKVARFAEVERSFRAGHARIHPDCPLWLLEEMLAFPKNGKHDDGVDAVSIATLGCPYAAPMTEVLYTDPLLVDAIARSRRRAQSGEWWERD